MNAVDYRPAAFELLQVENPNELRRSRIEYDYVMAGLLTDHIVKQTVEKRPSVQLFERIERAQNLRFVAETVLDPSVAKHDIWANLQFRVTSEGGYWRGTTKGNQFEVAIGTAEVDFFHFLYTACPPNMVPQRLLTSATG